MPSYHPATIILYYEQRRPAQSGSPNCWFCDLLRTPLLVSIIVVEEFYCQTVANIYARLSANV